eukprot:scaffold2774_cov109-Skeletonema_dohrnii-CCMP3373.AAC.1
MANYDGSLEAVDCHINSVRYDMVLESRAGGRLSDADTTEECLSRETHASILSWPTMIGHYKQLIVILTA